MISRKTNAPRQPTPAPVASSTVALNAVIGVDENWRATAFLPMKKAAAIIGVSTATVYLMHHRGELTLKRIGGRVVVPTAQVARIADDAPAWTASERGAAARLSRRKAGWEATDAAA